MTKASQTSRYGAFDHLTDFAKYYHRTPDVCIINAKRIDDEMLSRYKELGEESVVNDLKAQGYEGQIIETDLIDTSEYTSTDNHLSATYAHSIIRHDETKLKVVLENVIKNS